MPVPDSLRCALFTYGTQPRGGVLHALALAEALHAAGHDVVLHALAPDGRGFIREPRCPYVLVPFAVPRGDTETYVRGAIATLVAAGAAVRPGFDVYHAHDGITGNALATLVERGRIPHFVRTVHHLDDFGTSPLAALQERSLRAARAAFTVSRVWAERLARDYQRPATVVPNGVDTRRFRPANPELRARLLARGAFAPGPLFVTIGGIEARKNTLATLEAFALVRSALPTARLVIAGGASVLNHTAYHRTFEARCAQFGFGPGAIDITGVLPDVAIVALLRAADALVFPSLIEGFGLVVLEALACATPVVTSAIPPFTEFLTARDALLVDPNDPRAIAAAMLRARQPALLAAAVRGPAIAARFSWAASAAAHARAYRAALEDVTEPAVCA